MIRIIISPAKKMNRFDDYPVSAGRPIFLEKTRTLMKYLKELDRETLQGIWKCNDQIAWLNIDRLKTMDLERNVTPAVLAYEGIQYQSMAPGVFERKHLDYIRDHLYILSGFYGILGAFDGVVPYRLEMQARIAMEYEGKLITSLYDYWGRDLYDILAEGTDTIVNLASEEYGKAVKPWVQPGTKRIVNCVFGELAEKDGKTKVKVKATAAKMARGSMVRYMAEHQVEDVEQLKEFRVMGYKYREELSQKNQLVFIQETS